MFSRLFWWIASKVGIYDPVRFDIYKPRERLIFNYFDGKKMVRADPLILYKRLMSESQELSVCLKIATCSLPIPEADIAKAHSDVIKKIHSIFNLIPLEGAEDGTGVTDVETMEIFNRFMIWTEEIKKKSRPSQITVKGTLVPSKPLPEESPTISNSSASGSTVEEVFIEKRQAQPLEQALPLE